MIDNCRISMLISIFFISVSISTHLLMFEFILYLLAVNLIIHFSISFSINVKIYFLRLFFYFLFINFDLLSINFPFIYSSIFSLFSIFFYFYLFIFSVCFLFIFRGYVAVVNRSQKDINDDLPIRQGLIKEQKFFQSHPKYRDILSKCGTTNLARSLNQILMLHIRDCLPDIKARIMAVMASVQVSYRTLHYY